MQCHFCQYLSVFVLDNCCHGQLVRMLAESSLGFFFIAPLVVEMYLYCPHFILWKYNYVWQFQIEFRYSVV